MRALTKLIFVAAMISGLSAFGTDSTETATPPNPLLNLLEEVKSHGIEERLANQKREAEFLRRRDDQQTLFEQAKAELAKEEARSEALRQQYDTNEKTLSDMETTLKIEMGNIGEIFGTVRQVAGDMKAVFQDSLISTQIPGRVSFVADLAERKQLPNIEELEKLWYEIFRETVESGRIVSYPSKILTSEGIEKDATVTRIGTFNAIANGRFLRYLQDRGILYEMSRQPPSRYLKIAANYENLKSGYGPMIVDPSRGMILGASAQAPDLRERIAQGKLVGYVIIVILIIGLLVALERFVVLSISEWKIGRQLKTDIPSPKNALGRLMAVFEKYRDQDVDTLDLKLDEAILKETPMLERGLATLKIMAAIAPLLGLLGTVTGMIQVFQDMSIYGTGDPKIMADGISQALVTTVLGLVTAIPLVLVHSVLQGKSDSLTQILDERSAGLMAEMSEKK